MKKPLKLLILSSILSLLFSINVFAGSSTTAMSKCLATWLHRCSVDLDFGKTGDCEYGAAKLETCMDHCKNDGHYKEIGLNQC